jgi:hypothetical protein
VLKSARVELTGRDSGRAIELTELPALVADRCARAALAAIGEAPEGGVVALAMKHTEAVRALGERGSLLLQPFVDGTLVSGERLDVVHHLKDWRSISRLQQAALLLHVGFLIGRETVGIPIAMQIASIKSGSADTRAAFCSPHIAAVLHSKQATYRELETVLSTEDVFNLVELVNVEAIHAWRAYQQQAHKD